MSAAESIPEASVLLACPKCGDQEVGADTVVLTLSGQPWQASVSIICPCCGMVQTASPDVETVGQMLAAGVEPNRFELLTQDAAVGRFADDLHGVDYLAPLARRARPWSP